MRHQRPGKDRERAEPAERDPDLRADVVEPDEQGEIHAGEHLDRLGQHEEICVGSRGKELARV